MYVCVFTSYQTTVEVIIIEVCERKEKISKKRSKKFVICRKFQQEMCCRISVKIYCQTILKSMVI